MHPVETLLLPLGRALRHRHSGDGASIASAPQLATPNRLTVTSTAFADGEVIPAKHCGWLIGDEVSPALAWEGLPDGTEGLLLVIEDIDVPRPTPSLHTIAALTPRDGLAEGALRKGDGIAFQPTLLGRARYIGPRPIPGHGPHRYRFHVYALDTALDLDGVRGTEQLLAAVDGHVLASGTLEGTRES
jgi:Raf kinase inhibitor-like YbhB/YbcL family protein